MKHLILLVFIWIATPLWAVQPDEILPNPALESRARDISQGLRCLVCRNENIDDSNADLARDLRLLVRERLVAGDSDAQVVAFLVSRYGEFVLLKPRLGGSNLVLWGAGPAMLLLAGWLGFVFVRRRGTGEQAPLSTPEQERLAQILEK